MKKIFENEELEIYMDGKIEKLSNPIVENTLEKLELFRKIFKKDKLIKSKVIIFCDLEEFRKNACEQRKVESIPDYSRGWFNGSENACFLCMESIPLFSTKKYYSYISSIAHEIFHNLYKKYYYGTDRITWFDEGLAQYLSGEVANYNENDWYSLFNFYKNNSVYFNNLNDKINGDSKIPDERIFKRKWVFEGYAASLLVIKYLIDVYGEEYLYDLMFDNQRIREVGENILNLIDDYYKNLYHKSRNEL